MYKCLLLNVDTGGLIKRSLGAYRLATFLREHSWDAEVIEFVTHWKLDQLKTMLNQRNDKNLKFIGLSCLFIDEPIEIIDQFCEWVKETYPDIKILLGGPNRYRFNHKYIDYNIHGFGEYAALELLKYLYSNGPAPKFSMYTNSGKNIAANEMYPSFPMKSLMVKYEDRDFIMPEEWLGVEFSRGCIFSCAYCNFPVLGVKGDYSRDTEDFKLQMEDAYYRFGVKNYYTSDETFNDRTEKITKFANVVESLEFTPFFTGFVRPDLLVSRPGDKEELLRMNYLGHFYGVESFNHQTGKLIGKGMDPDRLKHGLLDIRNYFETHGSGRFRSTISLIAGLPKETVSSLYESRDWLVKHWQKQSYSIYPLEIPVSDYDNPSKIGMDWVKYGYSDASNDEGLKNFKLDRVTVKQAKFLTWKNEHMTIKEAGEVATDIDATKHKDGNDFRVGTYALIKLGLPDDIDQRLAVKEQDKIPQPIEFINNYIEKKLSL